MVGLGLVSVEVWEGPKCEEGYGAGYVCENVEKTESEKRETVTRRETLLQFHLIISQLLAFCTSTLKDCSQ